MWTAILNFIGARMAKSDEWETAEQYLERKSRDPEWVRMQEEKQARTEDRRQRLEMEQRPMLADLFDVGIRIKSVYDFTSSATTPSEAFPILMEHLEKPYDPVIREGIVRALTDRRVRGTAGPALLQCLAREPVESARLRWALANALTVVATPAEAATMKEMLEDDRYQDVHERLQLGLKKAYR